MKNINNKKMDATFEEGIYKIAYKEKITLTKLKEKNQRTQKGFKNELQA